MKTFDQYLDNKSYESLVLETAEIMVKAVEAGIDPEILLETSKEMLLEAGWADSYRAGSNMAQGVGSGVMGAMGGAAGVATHGLGSGLSGLWNGVKQGFKQAGRYWQHGSNSHNPSFQVKDAVAFLDKAIGKLQTMREPSNRIAARLKQYSAGLNKILTHITNIENPRYKFQQNTQPTAPPNVTPPANPTPDPYDNGLA